MRTTRNSQYDWPGVLCWIRESHRATGWPVTVRFIINNYFGGGVSTSVVHYHLKKWVAQGVLQKSPLIPGVKPPHKEIVL